MLVATLIASKTVSFIAETGRSAHGSPDAHMLKRRPLVGPAATLESARAGWGPHRRDCDGPTYAEATHLKMTNAGERLW